MRRLAVPALVLLASLIGCDDGAVADGGVTADAGVEAFSEPSPPAAPAPPCADGWSDCEPPAPGACPAGEVRFGDRAACVRLGSECPAGDWPDPLPEGTGHVFVRAGATGTGTQAAPFGSIEAGIRAAPSGGVVVVAPGVYDEALAIYAGVSVVGACAAQTIVAPTGADYAAVEMLERDASLEDVTVRAPPGGFAIDVANTVSLRDVAVEGGTRIGLAVRQSGQLDATRVVIRGVTGEPESGFGVAVLSGQATFHGLSITDCEGAAIVAEGEGGLVDVTGLYAARVEQGRPEARVVNALGGARVVARQSLIEEFDGAGFIAEQDGASILVEDTVVRRFGNEDGTGVGAFVARGPARIDVLRAEVSDGVGFGLVGRDDPIGASLEDVRFVDLRAGTLNGGFGVGWAGAATTELTLRRVAVERVEVSGITAGGGRCVLQDVALAGVGTVEADARIAVGFGSGIEVTAERVSIVDAVGSALLVDVGAGPFAMRDLLIQSPRPRADSTFGRAVELQAAASIARARIAESFETGVYATLGASVTLEDVHILDTRERVCAATTCPQAPGGHGILVDDGARLDARRFVIDGARLCGALVASGGELDLADGEVRNASVGACVQVDGYDTARLVDGVAFSENGINLDATTHALPTPSPPLP